MVSPLLFSIYGERIITKAIQDWEQREEIIHLDVTKLWRDISRHSLTGAGRKDIY